MSMGGSPNSGSSGSKGVYKNAAPEESGSIDISEGIFEQLLSTMGYEFVPKSGSGGQPGVTQLPRRLDELPDQVGGKNRRKMGAGWMSPYFGMQLQKKALTPEQQQQADFESQLKQHYQTSMLQSMQGQIPSAVQSQLDTIFNEQDRVGRERLMGMAREAAGARGLNVSDTPIGQPLLREYGNFQAQLGAGKAGAMLNERSAEFARAQGLREYATNLEQLRTVTNPMNLAQMTTQLGLGLYAPRFRVGTQSSGPGAGAQVGSILGGLGALGTGIGAMFSSRDFKQVHGELSDAQIADLVEEIEETPIYHWTYKPEFGGTSHIGPVVEEMPAVMTRGKEIDLVSALGTLTAAVKHLSKRVKELESRG